jgi:oligopeptide transport system substrate-binding protein
MFSLPTTWLLRSRFLLSLVVGAVAAIAISCGSGDGGSVSNDDGGGEQVFRLRLAGDPESLDPQQADVEDEISIVKQLYRGLFAYDKDLNVVPSVATEVPTKENGGISEDGLTYTLKLRDDVTWSDGTPLSSQDFVYAFQRLFDPDAGASGYYYSFYTGIKGATEASEGTAPLETVGVTAPDATTLQIELTTQQPTLPILLALWPVSPLRRDLIDQHGDAWTQAGNLIGNGPFTLAEYTPGEQIVLERNDAYWGDDAAKVSRIVYRIIPDDAAALLAYENGELDMTSIPTSDASRYEGNADQLRYPQLETYALQYGTAAEPFDDPLVRKAISRAIDREAYIKAVQSNVGVPALGWLPPGLPGYDAAVGAGLDFDPAEAKTLLSEAGFPNGEGFPDVSFIIADGSGADLTADFVKAQLKQNLGIDIGIEALEESVWEERFQSGDFQMSWSSWFADYADPENWLPQQFGTDGGFNIYAYSNPEVDELFEQAASELENDARLALYDQAHKIIIDDDQALTPLYYPERNFLVKSNVKGLTTTGLDAMPGDWFFTSITVEAAA